MADLKTTNIYGDAYINNKVGINTNTPATRLQIGQLSPTAATEGIQFGDDTNARVYRTSAGVVRTSGGFQAATYILADNYLQTGGNLIYPSGYGATQRLQVSNAANNAWIDGLTIAPGGIVTVAGNISAANLSGTNTGDQTIGNGTITIAAGTGVSVGATNTFTTNQGGATTVTITNSGVTSAVAGTGVGVSAATGAVTFSIGQAVGTGNTPSFAGIVSSAVTNYAFLQVTDTNNFWITPGNANWGLYFETTAGGLLGGTGDSNRLGFVGSGTARFYVDLNNGNGWFGGTLTAAGNISAANLSGTNTGDQTVGNGTITIAAGTGISVASNTFTTNQTGNSTVTVTNSGVTSLTTNTGLSSNVTATGAVTVTNTGVTSNVAGTGISVSGATGAVTITNSSPNATHTGDVTGATALTIANDAVTTAKILNANVTNVKLANSSLTIGSTAISLGATATTIAGLTSVTSTTFVGALTGNAATATNVAWSGITSKPTTLSGFGITDAASINGASNQNFSANSIYPYEWIRFMVDAGIYWQSGTYAGWHIHPQATWGMSFRSNAATDCGLQLRRSDATSLGAVYADGTSIGFLTAAFGWGASFTVAGTMNRGTVPLGRIETITAYTILGNNNASTAAVPSALTPAQVATMLSGQTMSIAGNASTATALTSMNISQFTNNSGYLTSAVTSLAGTTNRITVSGATGAVTLNLPQDIHTGASPTFAGLSLTSISTTGATITNLTGAYQNTTVYDSPRTQSATPSRGIRAPASSIQFTDSYAIAPFYTYRSTGDWPVPYGIGWGTGGESSGIFQRYASNGSSFGDMIFYTGNDGSGAFSFRRHTWEGTTYFAAGSGELNTELFRIDWSGNLTMLGTLNGSANSATLYANNGSYGSWKIGGTRNGWYGIEFDSGVSLMVNSTEVGFHRNGIGWQMRWSVGTGYIHKGSNGGGTEATILDSSNAAYAWNMNQYVRTTDSPTFGTLQLTRLNFGATGAAPYTSAAGEGTGNGITFGGDEAGPGYRIFTTMENVGGNYSKLVINWHTGIRIGAYTNYGGVRFYNNAFGVGTEIFSIGNTDSNVRVVNNLIVNGITFNQERSTNARIYGTTNGAFGLLGVDSAGSFRWQIYGDASNYGFLDSTWGNWDIKKAVNGELDLRVSSALVRVLNSGNYTTQTNGVLLRAAGVPAAYGDWNTFGNATQTTNGITQEFFNLGSGTGNSNFPPVVSYNYGILLNFGSAADARAQVYISHAGNDLIFRGGWGTSSWQTWNRVLTNINQPYAYAMNQYVRTTDTCSFAGLTVSNTINGSVSGNAGTVTNATFYRQFTVRDDRSDGGDYSLAARPTGLYAISAAGTNGPGATYLSLIHVANSNDVAFQIAGGYVSDNMYFRGTYALQNGTGYSAWRTVIHSGNIGSQTVATAGSCTGNTSGTAGSISGFNNPTTAATANTIVYRDGNGHISGQYILGSYLNASAGNSENPTIGQIWTQNTTDTYLRKSTPAHFRSQVTDGSYPSLTGANASGTWSISVTGNAGTATSATSATSATYLNSSNSIARTGTSGNYNTDFQNTPAGTVRHQGDDSNATNNPGGTWWFVDNYRHSNGGNYWGTQVAWGWEDQANKLATRNVNAGTFGSWVYYLNSVNYTDYTVTKTGTGASGNWAINVTGNAATATALTSMNISQFTNNSGYLTSVTNISGNAGTATLATKASTLSQGGGNGTGMTFNWSGQSGQPTWLWGSNDGTNIYVWNPSNFNVNSATTATTATNSTQLGGVAAASYATLTGTQTLSNKTVSGTFNATGNITENSTTQTNISGALTINVSAANVHVISLTNGANVTSITYNNRAASPSVNTLILVLKYAGSATVSWTNVVWANGTAPTLTGVNGFADVYALTSYQGGAATPVWIGTVVSQNLVSTNL